MCCSFNVRGTIERRKKLYMGSKSNLGRHHHRGNADNSITQVSRNTTVMYTSVPCCRLIYCAALYCTTLAQMAVIDDDNVSQAITQVALHVLCTVLYWAEQGGGCLTLHSKWKSQFDDSEASENETEMKGENLQSPEHRQPGENGEAGAGGGAAVTPLSR